MYEPLTDQEALLLNSTDPTRQTTQLGSRVQELEQGRVGVLEHAVGFSALTAEATTQTLALPALDSTKLVRLIDAWLVRDGVFAGGTATAVVVSLGWTDGASPDVDALILAQDVFTGADLGVTGDAAAAKGAWLADARTALVYPGEELTLTFTATDDDVDNLTEGELRAVVVYQVLGVPQHPRP